MKYFTELFSKSKNQDEEELTKGNIARGTRFPDIVYDVTVMHSATGEAREERREDIRFVMKEFMTDKPVNPQIIIPINGYYDLTDGEPDGFVTDEIAQMLRDGITGEKARFCPMRIYRDEVYKNPVTFVSKG